MRARNLLPLNSGMIQKDVDRLYRALSCVRRACRAFVCLVGMAVTVGTWAFQAGSSPDVLRESPVEPIVSPTYLEKISNEPQAVNKENGRQVSGLNTRFGAALGGNGQLNFSGGLFYSRETTPRELFDAGLFRSGTHLGLNADMPHYSGTLGLSQNLFTGNALSGGTLDQAYFQRLDYTAGGLNFSGSYGNIGEDFQGIADLKKQVAADDAKLLGLGLAQSNFALSYTGGKGMQFASTRSSVENALTGSAENGLTRTKQTNSLSLALGARQKMEYSIAELVESWNPAVAARAGKESQTQTMKWSGALGEKSHFSLGQTLVTAQTGEAETEDTRLRDLSLKWNEWKNLALSGGLASKANNLTGETNDVLNLNVNATISPDVRFTGKLVDNTTQKPADASPTENDLLDMRITANLAKNLQFISAYKDTDTTAQGTTAVRDQQINWTMSRDWKLTSHFVTTDNPVTDDTTVLEYTITGDIGLKRAPEQLSIYSRSEVLSTTAAQDRCEITYTRAVGGGMTPAKLLVRAGTYQRTAEDARLRDDMMVVQLVNWQVLPRTTSTLGYYDGPLLGAGYLNYRTWGERYTGNSGIWGAGDFAPYREIGGEVVHRLTGATKLSLKQMHGELHGMGTRELQEYGLEQQIGRAQVQGSRLQTVTPGKDGRSLAHEALLWKLNVPGAAPLPDWAATSMRFTVFQDSATWGFGVLPDWIPMTRPVSGLAAEKREGPDTAGKLVDQYTVKFAWMPAQALCMQLSHEENPLKAGTLQADALRRRYVHLGYCVQPKLQLFGRFIDEDRKDQPVEQRTYSMGIIGHLSAIDRLQMQYDGIKRASGGSALFGSAYQVEYERTVNKDDALSVKVRMNPEEFFAEKERVKVEASYRKVF